MAEGTSGRLNYGHAGIATFNVDTRIWSFTRQFQARTFKQIKFKDQTSVQTVPSSIHFPPTASSTRLSDADHHVKALIRDYAQLSAASEIIPELAVTSAAIDSATATFDPLIGNLYSVGSITYATNGSTRYLHPRRVVASVTGEAGDILRLGFLSKETLGWEDSNWWLRGVSLNNTDPCGYWNNGAAPIQQVCFSQSSDRSTLLAVRLPTRTVIFRPFFSQRSRVAKHSPYYDLPASLIDTNPILSLDISQSGGSSHVDVSFNPDFQYRFAVIDQNHTWSIWDIDYIRTGDKHTLSHLLQGTTVPPEDMNMTGEDGWARILWVGDVNTFLVCNRRRLSLIGIQGASFAYLQCPALVSKRSSDWILNVQPHPLHRGLFFVLTSSDLFLMAVTTAGDAIDANAGPVGAHVLSSWGHYRGADDITLTMSAHMVNENETCVILHSRLNSLVQMYTFTNPSSPPNAFVLSENPSVLDIILDHKGHTLQFAMEPFELQTNESATTPGLGEGDLMQGLQFFRLFMLRSDLGVHEAMIYSTSSLDESVERENRVVDISWSKSYRLAQSLRTPLEVDEMDDFLLPDRIDVVDSPETKLMSQRPISTSAGDETVAQRMVDHRPLYDAMVHEHPEFDRSSGSVDVQGLVDQFQQLLDDPDRLYTFPSTILEFVGVDIEVSDIDEASSALQSLLLGNEQGRTARVEQIASWRSLHRGEGEQPTISDLYDSILQSWVASLPPQVPVRFRQHSERLARRVAAEVILAGMRHSQPGQQTVALDAQSSVHKRTDMTMPILSSQPLDSSPPRVLSTQPLPTPPLSQSGSQPFPSQSLGLSSAQTPSIDTNSLQHPLAQLDPVARLSRHLRFKEDVLPQISIPDSVQQLLGQWQPGTDPHTYDWNAAETADRVDDLDEISQQELEKARRKKERRERRQRREDELAQSQPSSQPFTAAPVVHPRSSPGPVLGGIGSSSQIPSQPFVQLPTRVVTSQGQSSSQPFVVHSQMEPGRFGGRPDKKKKKKGGRVSGF